MRTHGKGIRPTLALLCGFLGDHRPDERCIRAAVLVELLHEATLVHDDVVDDADTRRGWPSLPAKFKNKVSVLFGDYMLSTVLAMTLESRDMKWLDILSETARRMSRGELNQAARAKRVDMNEEDYLKMIGDKTAALFSAACRLGGLTSGLNDEQVEALGVYGEQLGIAFQIKDDLLDLFGDSGIGKPLGGDLKEKKLTLPLLHILSKVPPREASRIRARIRRGIKRGEIKDIAALVRDQGGESYAVERMELCRQRAVDALNAIPECPAREYLINLTSFAVERRM